MTATDDVLLATVRDFTDRSGAQRVVIVLDRGDGASPPVIECEPGEPIAVSSGDEDVIVMAGEFAHAEPIWVDVPKAIPATAIEADADTGQISAPIGVQSFADALTTWPGRSVAGPSRWPRSAPAPGPPYRGRAHRRTHRDRARRAAVRTVRLEYSCFLLLCNTRGS